MSLGSLFLLFFIFQTFYNEQVLLILSKKSQNKFYFLEKARALGAGRDLQPGDGSLPGTLQGETGRFGLLTVTLSSMTDPCAGVGPASPTQLVLVPWASWTRPGAAPHLESILAPNAGNASGLHRGSLSREASHSPSSGLGEAEIGGEGERGLCWALLCSLHLDSCPHQAASPGLPAGAERGRPPSGGGGWGPFGVVPETGCFQIPQLCTLGSGPEFCSASALPSCMPPIFRPPAPPNPKCSPKPNQARYKATQRDHQENDN